jgi:hypothetical protein
MKTLGLFALIVIFSVLLPSCIAMFSRSSIPCTATGAGHVWGRWSLVKDGYEEVRFGMNGPVKQRRTCTACGKESF